MPLDIVIEPFGTGVKVTWADQGGEPDTARLEIQTSGGMGVSDTGFISANGEPGSQYYRDGSDHVMEALELVENTNYKLRVTYNTL